MAVDGNTVIARAFNMFLLGAKKEKGLLGKVNVNGGFGLAL